MMLNFNDVCLCGIYPLLFCIFELLDFVTLLSLMFLLSCIRISCVIGIYIPKIWHNHNSVGKRNHDITTKRRIEIKTKLTSDVLDKTAFKT